MQWKTYPEHGLVTVRTTYETWLSPFNRHSRRKPCQRMEQRSEVYSCSGHPEKAIQCNHDEQITDDEEDIRPP